MLPIETIISPTDFSRPSEQGLAAAVDLSRQFDAGLVLLHVIAPLPAVTAGVSVPGHHMPTILDELDRESRRLMDRLVQDRVPSDLPCRTQIVRGRPADEIVRLAEEMEAAMIVIASSNSIIVSPAAGRPENGDGLRRGRALPRSLAQPTVPFPFFGRRHPASLHRRNIGDHPS